MARQDIAFDIELNNSLRATDRLDLSSVIRRLQSLLGDVCSKLDDLDGLAIAVEDRVVGALDPDFATVFGEPLELGRRELAALQRRPEVAVIAARRVLLIDKHPVMLTLDLFQPIAHRVEEVVIGILDDAIHSELNETA